MSPTLSKAAENLGHVIKTIKTVLGEVGRADNSAQLIAVSKTFDTDAILPVIQAGQKIFGENRVQEAQKKWPELKTQFGDIELHLIGPLQSNKAGDAVALFDVIETIDREKIAAAIAKEINKQGRRPKLLVQVNTGEEEQKAGIAPRETSAFVKLCQEKYDLEISGLMCIPPFDENPGPHFALLKKLADQAGLETLSMGMSGDYEIALQMGATHVRVGSAIFGTR